MVEMQLYKQTTGIEGWMELKGRGFQQPHTSASSSSSLPRMQTPPAPNSNTPSR